MILLYDRNTGVILDALISNEIRDIPKMTSEESDAYDDWMESGFEGKKPEILNERESELLKKSVPQKVFLNSQGKPLTIPINCKQLYVKDTPDSAKYLYFLRDKNKKPIWKIIKQGNIERIVPISGEYPEGWNDFHI